MSTSIAAANGVVVVTQVFPQDKNGKVSVPVPNVTPTILSFPQAPPVKVSEMTKMFLRGEPQSLGIVQIFIGLVCMIVSLSAILSPDQIVQAPLFMGVAFVLSGSLAVAAQKGTGLGLIRATLAVNLISILVGLTGIAYICFLLATRTNEDFCDLQAEYGNMTYGSRGRERCIQMMWQLNNILAGVRGLLLVLTVLEVCVAVTVCVFSGKAIARRGVYSASPTTVVVESGSPPSVCGSDVALLGGTDEEPVTIPPPYSP